MFWILWGIYQMTNLFKKAALAATVASFAFAAPAFAQSATEVDADGTATVKIYTPLTLTATSGDSTIDFGILVAGGATRAAAASFAMSTDGADTVSCAAAWLCSGTTKAANFSVAGTDGASVHVDLPLSVTLTNTASTDTVSIAPVTDFVDPANVVLGALATDFLVAGTLSVPANTPDGVYVGDFNITADYN